MEKSQENHQIAEYLEYLKNVLGVSTIIQSSEFKNHNSLANVEVEKNEVKILFCVESFKSYNEVEIELLKKMIAAVKVDSSDIGIVDLSEVSKYSCQFAIYFTDSDQKTDIEMVELAHPQNFVQTYSPRTLNIKPELKKNAWGQLQKVLQFLSTQI